MGLRDKILSSKDVPSELVPVPEWGVEVEVRGMTVAEQRDFYDKVTDTHPKTGERSVNTSRFQVQQIIACTFDPDTGERLFQQGDADTLAGKSAAASNRLIAVASRLSGLGGDDELEATVEDLGGTPGGDSG